MKKILLLYYTQTGQLNTIISSVTSSFQDSIELDKIEIKPVTPYPFPWSFKEFFNTFPESVLEVPCLIQPISIDESVDYDLIILAYQPWFLSPSIPIASFLQTSIAEKLFKGKPVITIIGCRNMWVQAQESVKQQLKN